MKRALDKLTIRGFRSIRRLEDFELKNLNVLVGANGAGKSNFVEFFRLLSAMMKEDGLSEYIAGNADAYLYGGPKYTSVISVKLCFGANGYDFSLFPTEDGRFMVSNERRHFFTENSTRILTGGGFNPGLLTDKNNEGRYPGSHSASWYTYTAMASWTIYHFHDTSKNAGMRRKQDVAYSEKLFTDARNIAPFLRRLKVEHEKTYGEIINVVRLVVPFFDDFILEPDANEEVRLSWRQKGLNDYPMRPTQLSDGSIRFICLATALLQPDPPSTIIIDEPELGLHPEAIRILGELINTASQRTQVVVATQSPLLMDQFAIENIIVVNRKDGQSVFERLKPEEFTHWLEDFSVGELWVKDVIQGGASHE